MKKTLISDVAEVNPRIPRELQENPELSVTFLPMSQVSELGCVQPNETRPLGEVLRGFTYFEDGDVLIAKITPCMENGKAAYVENMTNGIGFGSTEFHVLRPSERMLGKYLFYMVWNPFFRHVAEGSMTGSAGQKRVPSKFFDRFEIPLPSLEEQRRVVQILDTAFILRDQHIAASQLSSHILSSCIQQAFDGAL